MQPIHPYDQLELNEIYQLLAQNRTEGLLTRVQRLASAYPQNVELRNLTARLTPAAPPTPQQIYYQPLEPANPIPAKPTTTKKLPTRTIAFIAVGLVVAIALVVFLVGFLRDAGYKTVTLSDLVNNSSIGDKVSFRPTNYAISNICAIPGCGLGSTKPITPTAEQLAEAKKQSLLVVAYTDNSYTTSVLLDFTRLGNVFDTYNAHPTIYGTVTTIGTNSVDVVVDYYK